MIDVDVLSARIAEACKKRKWRKDWSNGGCYLHLEASEFIESLRGKGGMPEQEAADVFITLMALIGSNGVDARLVEQFVYQKIQGIENGTVGVTVNYEEA